MTRTTHWPRLVIRLALLSAAAACSSEIPPTEPPPPTLDAQVRQAIQGWGVLPIGPVARQSPAMVDLGRSLFFDKVLSGNRDVSCGTCHVPGRHLGDGLSLAVGTGARLSGDSRIPGDGRQFVPRNAPSLLNLGTGLFYMFWDGRLADNGLIRFDTTTPPVLLPPSVANNLVAQAMFPVLNRVEMRGVAGDRDVFGNPNELAEIPDAQYAEVWRAAMRRLLAIQEYVAKFNAAFPSTPTSQLGFEHAARALTAFEIEAFTRTDSPFDRFLERDNGAMSVEAKRGALLFFGKARCSQCHSGPLLGGQQFASVAAPQLGPGVDRSAPLDFGRGAFIDRPEYRFVFRVPPLRNVELTAPYMHDGAYRTLEAVVRHYNDVGRALREYDVSQLDPAVRATYHGEPATINALLQSLDFRLRDPLRLTDAELADLVAFLKSLTDPAARDLAAIVPASVPSGLPVR